MLKKSASFVLGSSKSSTYPRGYASGFDSPAALLDGLFEHLLRKRGTDTNKHEALRSEHLQDKTFQITRFRHGRENRVVARLPALFKQANLPLCIPRSQTNARPQLLFSNMV